MTGGELFILLIFSIPVYGFGIYAYKEPEDSYMIGKRWMYDNEPELSKEAIKLHKNISLITIIVWTILLISGFISVFR